MPVKITCQAKNCENKLYDHQGDMAALQNMAEFNDWQRSGSGWLCPDHREDQ